MSITIQNTPALRNAVAKLTKLTQGKSVLPITKNILLRLEGDYLNLRTTDLDIHMRSWANADRDQCDDTHAIDVAVPAKLFLDLLKRIGDKTLTLRAYRDPAQLTVSWDKALKIYKLAGENGEDFPACPKFEDAQEIVTRAYYLKKALKKVPFAASKDPLKPHLNGVLFDFDPGGANFVATDAHRLAHFFYADASIDKKFSFILPLDAVKHLDFLNNHIDAGGIPIHCDRSYVSFENEQFQLIARHTDATFPAWRNTIPAESNGKVIVNKKELEAAIKRLDLVAHKQTKLGVVDVADKSLTVQVENRDTHNTATDSVHALFEGEWQPIGLSLSLLLSLLQTVETEDVILDFASPSQALMLSNTEWPSGQNMTLMLMPVLLSSNRPSDDVEGD